MQSNRQNQKHPIANIFRLILNNWIKMLITFILIVSAVAFFTFRQPKTYESTASVLVKDRNINLGLGSLTNYGGSADKFIPNQIEILQSSRLLSKVTDTFLHEYSKLDPDTKKNFRIINDSTNFEDTLRIKLLVSGYIKSSVGIESGKRADVISITAVTGNPYEAAFLANIFATTYYQDDLERSRANATEVRKFLEDQYKNRLGNLTDSEEILKNFLTSVKPTTLNSNSNNLLDRVNELKKQLDNTEIEYENTKLTLNQYKKELENVLPDYSSGVTTNIINADDLYIKEVQKIIAKNEAERDLIIITNKANSNTPEFKREVNRKQKAIDSLKTILEARTRNYLDNSLGKTTNFDQNSANTYVNNLQKSIQDAELKLTSLQLTREMLYRTLSQYTGDLSSLPSNLTSKERLEREKEFNEKLYLKLGEQYQEAMLTELSTFGRVEIVDKAYPPSAPSGPRVASNMAVGIILGGLISFLLVFFADKFKNFVQTPEELEYMGLNVISTIPLLESSNGKQNGKPMKLIAASNEQTVPFIESFQRILIYLSYSQTNERQVITLTSPIPGEGKSSTTLNLAINLAKSNKKVIVVDCDLRKPSVHNYLDVKATPSLISLMANKASLQEVIKQTPYKNMDVITTIEFSDNPSLILTSNKFKQLLEMLKARYDYVLLDTPPCNAVTDAIYTSKISDKVFLVTRADHSNMEEVKRARNLFEQYNIKLDGVILNGLDDKRIYSYYGKYYGKYSGSNSHGINADVLSDADFIVLENSISENNK